MEQRHGYYLWEIKTDLRCLKGRSTDLLKKMGEWRIMYNKALYQLYGSLDIITNITLARHVQRSEREDNGE